MRKEDAAAFIGVSVRTLQRLTHKGQIPFTQQPGPKGKETHYEQSDLAAYIERNRPAAIMRPAQPRQDAPSDVTTALARVQSIQQSPALASLAAFGASSKILLSLADARALTGLSKQFLTDAIKAGKLKGKVIGRGYKIKRTDLDLYVKKL
jgi:excisionase family DNA binding protein